VRSVEWRGQKVDTVVSQFVSFSDGRIEEVALDYTAQDDDGSVWYFGESVSNYKNGVVSGHEGSWLAGKDGPPGMLMPAHPHVGDVFRSENIPGLVFEEDTVVATDVTAPGPFGPVAGSVRIHERPVDGDTEDKTYGPGYGEMIVDAGDEQAAIEVAVPTDAVNGPVPSALQAGSAARLASIDAAQAALDLQLRYRPVAAVDLDRMEVWVRQVDVDVGARAWDGVVGDVATLEVVRDRVVGGLDAGGSARLDGELRGLRAAAAAKDVGGVEEAAARLLAALAALPRSG
jgi:hypothetical protein